MDETQLLNPAYTTGRLWNIIFAPCLKWGRAVCDCTCYMYYSACALYGLCTTM